MVQARTRLPAPVRGAIVLAGGPSRRFGRPKPLASFRGRPLVLRVVDAARGVSDEVAVVGRGPLASEIASILPAHVHLVRDARRVQTPVVGLLAGAAALRSPYVAALACDLPLLRPPLLARLFQYARGRDAAIPRWPDGRIEPLVAVYRREALLVAAREALRARTYANQDVVRRLHDVRYVSTDTLRSVDRDLLSFANVNTRRDLSRALRL